MSDYLNPCIQETMNLREWLEDRGALRDGARIGWASVTWTIQEWDLPEKELRLVNDDTFDSIDLGTCASLPAAGWRVLE